MRILRIEILNLNSLRGEHVLDFTEPPLAGASLFAITGPTGAGKTTILDAITLALYGRTRRLSTGTDEVITHGAIECKATVEFETTLGRFRSTWLRRKKRGKADQELTAASVSVSDAITGEILAEKVRDVGGKIKELTGLDFDQFMRSALLAQGDFAAFLQAKPAERAELLEQITGTRIYSIIADKVKEKHKAVETRVSILREQRKTIGLLSEEEKAAKIADLSSLMTQIQANEAAKTDSEKKLRLCQAYDEALQQFHNSEQKLTEARRLDEGMNPDRERLTLHRKLLPLKQQYDYWVSQLGEEKRIDLEISKLRNNLEDYLAREKTLIVQHQEAETAMRDFDSARGQRDALLDQVSGIDAQITELRKQAEEVRSRLKELEIDRNSLSTAHQTASKVLDGLKQELNAKSDWLDKHASYKHLHENQSVFIVRFGEWRSKSAQIDRIKNEAKGASDSINLAQRKVELLDARIAEAKQTLEKMSQDSILAELRDELRPGHECPLCGSTHHPYSTSGANVNAASLDLVLMAKQSDERAKLKSFLNDCQAEREEALQGLISYKKNSEYLAEQVQNLEVEASAIYQQDLLPLLESAGIAIPERNLNQWIESLKSTLEQYAHASKELDSLAKSILEKKPETAIALEKLAICENRFDEAKQRYEKLCEEGKNLKAKRIELAGSDEKVDAIRASLKSTEDKLRNNHDEAKSLLDSIRQELSDTSKTIELYESQVSKVRIAINENHERLSAAASQLGLQDVFQIQSGVLTDDEATHIEQRTTEARENLNNINGHHNERGEILRQTQEAIQGLEPQELISEKLAELQESLKNDQTRIGSLQQELASDESQQNKAREIEDKLQAVEFEFSRWDRLKALISPKSKDDFNRYAQSLTLEQLVKRANAHLTRVFPRYRILRNAVRAEDLDLLIEDRNMANQTRSMQTLSGGESFVVSLALALGLADLAGGRVRIDSLFIDEGFGTLDPQTLDQALTALENLQSTGKSVGVISHVEAMKERIGTQIQVVRVREGESRLRVV